MPRSGIHLIHRKRVSLRLGHDSGLEVHRTSIQYLVAATLPFAQGEGLRRQGFWGRRGGSIRDAPLRRYEVFFAAGEIFCLVDAKMFVLNIFVYILKKKGYKKERTRKGGCDKAV